MQFKSRGNQKENSSETTVYQDAVCPKRGSSSTEELNNTSDKSLMEISPDKVNTILSQLRGNSLNEPVLSDGRTRERERDYDHGARQNRDYATERDQHRYDEPPERQAERRAEELIRQAETQKAKIYDVPGRCLTSSKVDEQKFLHSLYVDANYAMVASHVDDITRRKIENCEYVDFGKLMPRDQVMSEEDNRMVPINENGEQYWKPFADTKITGISSYSKWEVAFRVFSDIFARKFAEKSPELIQYGHVIYTTSLSHSWEQVYGYDREFRIHMSRYPLRSWGIILQSAWNMKLGEKPRSSESAAHSDNNGNNYQRSNGRGGSSKKKEICRRYNRGNCTYGTNCRFDHKCVVCLKFGHGAFKCRKNVERSDSRRTDSYDRNDGNNYGYNDRR